MSIRVCEHPVYVLWEGPVHVARVGVVAVGVFSTSDGGQLEDRNIGRREGGWKNLPVGEKGGTDDTGEVIMASGTGGK